MQVKISQVGLLFLAASGAAQEQNCFYTSKAAYGDQSLGTELSDSEILKADRNFTPDSRIKQIDYCWNSDSTGELVGLRTTVGKLDSQGSDITLNTFGVVSTKGNCRSFTFEPGEMVTTMQISYTENYVQSISMVTNLDKLLVAGAKADSASDKIYFGKGLPLVGFYGTSTKKLGLVTYHSKQCDPDWL